MIPSRRRGVITEFLAAFPAVLGRKFWPRAGWLLAALVLLAVVRSIVGDCCNVPSGSMIPTLLDGDRVYVNKLAYGLRLPFTNLRLLHWANPRRGDIVVLHSPRDGVLLVKRIVGLPGEVISLSNGVLRINGRAARYNCPAAPGQLEETLANPQRHNLVAEQLPFSSDHHSVLYLPGRRAIRSFDPVTIPVNKYFVMGDNRDESLDSRYFGGVDGGQIIGQADRVLVSLGDNYLPRSNRWFKALH